MSLRSRARAIPAPLVVLLVAATLLGTAWCIVLPPFQGPDEASHFTYTQWIVEHGEIPWQPTRESIPLQTRPTSTELDMALYKSGFGQLQGNPSARPWWTALDERHWATAARGLTDEQRRDEIGEPPSFLNGPVYYLYSALPYTAARSGTFFDRMMVMRLANIPLLLIALVFVWLVAGELVGRGWPQVVAAAVALSLPQLLNLTASVNPDLMLAALGSATIYVILLVLRIGPRRRLLGLLGLLCLLGALTHVRMLPMLAPAAMAVVLALARERGWAKLTPLRLSAAAGAGIAGLMVVAASAGGLHRFGSYLWQFYLPRLPFQNPDPIGPAGHGFLRAFVDQLFGKLALLEVLPPDPVKVTLQLVVLASIAAFVIVLVIRRRGVGRRVDVIAVLGIAVFAMLAFLHASAYRNLALRNPGDPQITGRYLFPLLPLIGCGFALIATTLPRRAAAVFAGLLLAGGVAIQVESLRLLLERFYA